MNEILIDKSEMKFPICIGHQIDHNCTQLNFKELTGTNNYLKLWEQGTATYEPIPLPNNTWIVTNTYTQKATTFKAQLMKKVDGEYICNSQVFELYLKESICGNEFVREVVPPNYKTKYDEMVSVTDKVKQDLASGKLDGLSAYELAVKNGFVGTEKEWLASLDYEHSQEFTDLANQVKNDSQQVSVDKTHIDTTIVNFNVDYKNKVDGFNIDYTNKTNAFNQNVVDKTKTFNDNVTQSNASFDNKVKQANTSLELKETQINNDLDVKINQANTTIDTKVNQASDSATQAQTSANQVQASVTQIQKNANDIALLKTDKTEIELLEKTTNKKHKLYIMNGKLMMEEVI